MHQQSSYGTCSYCLMILPWREGGGEIQETLAHGLG